MAKLPDIDFVVPFVFPGDPQWQSTFHMMRLRHMRFDGDKANGERFRSWGIERLLLRSVAKCLPWVSKVHVILASESQVPEWMNLDTVNVVFHSDIMPEEMLPTYNSSSFELFLHNIPGLSEMFLYGNDDMVFTSPMKRSDFFKAGKPVCRHFERVIGKGVFQRTIRNALELAASDTGTSVPIGEVWTTGHSIAPLLKSVIEDVWTRQGDRLMKSCSPFRDTHNINGYVWQYVNEMRHLNVEGLHDHVYFTRDNDVQTISDAIEKGSGVVCFNDCGKGDYGEYRKWVEAALTLKFPGKCKYEK